MAQEITRTTTGRLSDTFQVGGLIEFVNPVTNLSVNSVGGVLHEIKLAERIHWFDGLRCAELFIKQYQEALVQNQYTQRKLERQKAQLEDDLVVLKLELEQLQQQGNGTGDLPGNMQLRAARHQREVNRLKREIEAKEDRIAQIDFNQNQVIPMVRDAGLLTATAIAERNRILDDHPEALDLEFQQLQAQISPEVVRYRQAKYIAGRTMGLPETAGVALIDIPPEERELAMRLAAKYQSGIDTANLSVQVQGMLSGRSEDERRAILTKAIQLAAQSTPSIQQNRIDPSAN